MPVIPATWEAEAGESFEPGRLAVRGDCAIALQPGQQEQNSVSKKYIYIYNVCTKKFQILSVQSSEFSLMKYICISEYI